MKALASLGVPVVVDYSLGISEGAALMQITQNGGWRHSTAKASYLGPARHRANLTVQTHPMALRLLLQGGRCVGVRAQDTANNSKCLPRARSSCLRAQSAARELSTSPRCDHTTGRS